MKIRVLLADDHAIVREGLRMILESQPDIIVAGEAKDGREAIAQATALLPDVVVMDIAMPLLNGIEATELIRLQVPKARTVILSMHYTPEYLYRAVKAGALGYLLKECAGPEILEALRTVMAGKTYFSKRISDTPAFILKQGEAVQSPLKSLSKREREVLQLIVEGYTCAEIGDMLRVSPKSVETYRSRMMQKLSINDVPALVKFAMQHGITPPA